MSLRRLTIILLGCLVLGCTGSEQPTAPGAERDEWDRFGIDQDPNRPASGRDGDSSGALDPDDSRWTYYDSGSWRPSDSDSCSDIRHPGDWYFDWPDSLPPGPGGDDSTRHIIGRPDSTWLPESFAGYRLITFRLREEGPVTVIVRDREGNALDTVIDEYLEEGDYSIDWDGVLPDGTVAPPGVYFYRVDQRNWHWRGLFLRYP